MVGLGGPFVVRVFPVPTKLLGFVCRLLRYSSKYDAPDPFVSSIMSVSGGPIKSGTPGGIVELWKELVSRFLLLFGNGGPYSVIISKSPYIRRIKALFWSINCSMRSLKLHIQLGENANTMT